MKQVISTPNAPTAIGPYSQAILANNILFTSGQIALIPETGAIVNGTIEEQAEQCCKNIQAILAASNMTFDNVIKTTCFLTDMGDFSAFNSIYEKYFVSKPARSCIAVKELPKRMLCEIEAIAIG